MGKSIKQFILDNKEYLVEQDELRYSVTATTTNNETYTTDCIVKGNVGVKITIERFENILDENGFYTKVDDNLKSLQLTEFF